MMIAEREGFVKAIGVPFQRSVCLNSQIPRG